ncbi:MAG: hypothetical protein Q4E59_00275 [Bacteroidales bacterium]|nr:hypothetical protein [Bacteroidales bacterium]
MNSDFQNNVVTEPTEDGLFIAYFSKRMMCYAYGETAVEAESNLLERYDFNPDNWSDFDEYCYLSGAIM